MRIAINGAGIAGPTLAYWLRESGHEVLLVEEAPQLRSGGYIVDFWGVGYDIAEKMGLRPRRPAAGLSGEGGPLRGPTWPQGGGFSVDVFGRLTHGRFTSLPRSDLAATIYRALDGRVETIFGDSIAAHPIKGDRVCVTFDHAASARSRPGHRRRWAALARPPPCVRAAIGVRGPARLPRRRIRDRRLSAAR